LASTYTHFGLPECEQGKESLGKFNFDTPTIAIFIFIGTFLVQHIWHLRRPLSHRPLSFRLSLPVLLSFLMRSCYVCARWTVKLLTWPLNLTLQQQVTGTRLIEMFSTLFDWQHQNENNLLLKNALGYFAGVKKSSGN